MTEPTEPALESKTPLFDVMVAMPPGARLEEIERLARSETDIASDRIDRLVSALRSTPQVKIGVAVSRDRADKAKEQFGKTGLQVTITPVLSIQAAMAGSYDGTHLCPACETRVVLPENRQCPSCGVFVDKVTDEFLLRRKLLEQERGKIEFQQAKSAKDSEKRSRELMEASLRAKIREELEKEYGLGEKKGLLQGVSGPVRAAALLGLVAIAFLGGRGLSPEGFLWSKAANAKESAYPKVMTADTLAQTSKGATTGGPDAVGSATGADISTGDLDIDDPLIQAAGGKRIGAKGLTIEQALGAAQVLAKSVGNTTAERALAGGNVGGSGGGGPGGAGGGSTAGNAIAGANQASGAAPASLAVAVPKQTKLVLTAEFAGVLAEMGQVSRAKEILRAATASLDPAADAEAATVLKYADLKTQAWAVQRLDAGRARQATEDLKVKILALANPAERTQLLGSVAVILSRSPQLPSEIPRAFLSDAAESLKSVTGPGQPSAALGDLAVSMAEVFSSEASARVKVGAWSKAKTTAAQVEDLIKQAPDSWSQLRLYAIDHQIKLQLGNKDRAIQSLEAALAQAGKNANPLERTVWLRSIAQLADAAAQEQMEAMTTGVQSQLQPKSGLEKAQALTQLALLYAAGGLPAKSEHFGRLARETAGLSSADSALINTDLIVRNDLAMARMLQGLGRYAEAETLLQRVGGYLF